MIKSCCHTTSSLLFGCVCNITMHGNGAGLVFQDYDATFVWIIIWIYCNSVVGKNNCSITALICIKPAMFTHHSDTAEDGWLTSVIANSVSWSFGVGSDMDPLPIFQKLARFLERRKCLLGVKDFKCFSYLLCLQEPPGEQLNPSTILNVKDPIPINTLP